MRMRTDQVNLYGWIFNRGIFFTVVDNFIYTKHVSTVNPIRNFVNEFKQIPVFFFDAKILFLF